MYFVSLTAYPLSTSGLKVRGARGFGLHCARFMAPRKNSAVGSTKPAMCWTLCQNRFRPKQRAICTTFGTQRHAWMLTQLLIISWPPTAWNSTRPLEGWQKTVMSSWPSTTSWLSTESTSEPQTRSRAPSLPFAIELEKPKAASAAKLALPWRSNWWCQRKVNGANSTAQTECLRSLKRLNSRTGSSNLPKPPNHTVTNFWP